MMKMLVTLVLSVSVLSVIQVVDSAQEPRGKYYYMHGQDCLSYKLIPVGVIFFMGRQKFSNVTDYILYIL